MLHALGFSGRAGGVQDKQRVLSAHGHRRTYAALTGQGVAKSFVAAGHHIACSGGALVNKHGFDRLAAAHGQAFVHHGFEWQFFAATHLVVRSNNSHRASVDDAFLQGFGGKAAKNYAVRGADACTSLHGNDALKRHGHIDQHSVAFLNACGL